MRFEADGSQYREFREAAQLCDQMDIEKFVVPGPRTAAWVLRFMCENGGTPLGRHAKFKAEAQLTHADPGVTTHEHLCKLLQTAVTVDQYDVTNSAMMELLCREIQMIEEKYSDRLRTKDLMSEESEYYLRTTTGSSSVCMCPALRAWVGEELRADAAVMKERRKAIEVRRPPKKEAK